MTRKVREIQDLVIDEISLVDKGANQHATVTIAKSADGEKESYMDIYDEQGNPLDPDALEIGDVVYDASGDAYQVDDDAGEEGYDEEEAEENERELASVGKSSAFATNTTKRPAAPRREVGKSYSQGLREELSKALTDRDRDDVISKAFDTLEFLAQDAQIAKAAAEQERDIRLTQEYVEIAKAYELPGIDAQDLGGVLKRVAEALSYEDCEVIGKALAFAADASEQLYSEIGSIGGGDNSDILSQVDAFAQTQVGKSAGQTHEDATTAIFAANPDAYDEYLSERSKRY